MTELHPFRRIIQHSSLARAIIRTEPHTLTLRIRYVAPERLNNETFVQMISNTKIRLLAIDEAHCISEWGHAFRPDYLKSMGTLNLLDLQFG